MPALEPAWQTWEPLRLSRRDAIMVRGSNMILQRAHMLPVELAGQPWSITLQPAAPPPADPPWCLDLVWGGVPFKLILPAQSVRDWLATSFADLELPDLPDVFMAAFLETAARAALGPLSRIGRGELRVIRIERSLAATQGMEETWSLQLKSEAACIDGWLSTTRKGVMHLAACLQDWLPASGPLGADQLPLVLRAEVGFTWMTASEWAVLRPGDAILVERPLLAPDGEFWLGCGPLRMRARQEQGRLFVTSNWREEMDAMGRDDDDDLALGPLDDLRRVPLRVTFDVGELRMTFGQVEALQVGEALDLGRPLSEAVQIRIHGARVGLGELVDIDGRLGVVLRSLSTTDLSELPWSSQAPEDDADLGLSEPAVEAALELPHDDLPEPSFPPDSPDLADLPDLPPAEA